MDEAGMKLWVEKVERSQPGGLLRKTSVLIWDSSRQLSEVSSTPNKNRHRCSPRCFNQHSSTARRFPTQAI